MCGAIGIVLNPLDNGRNTILASLEVDDAVFLLVTTATMTCSDPAIVVTPAGLGLLFHQGCIRLALVQTRRLDLDYAAASG